MKKFAILLVAAASLLLTSNSAKAHFGVVPTFVGGVPVVPVTNFGTFVPGNTFVPGFGFVPTTVTFGNGGNFFVPTVGTFRVGTPRTVIIRNGVRRQVIRIRR